MDGAEEVATGIDVSVGRRERKKAATRASISVAALELFLEHGFDAVSVRDVADRADVAAATVFAHFDGKEALVFDEDEAVARSLVGAVEHPRGDDDVLAALEGWFLASRAADGARAGDPEFVAFRQLVDRTPALRGYWRTMWRRYEPALARAIGSTAGVDPRLAHLTATLAIEGYLLAAEDERSDTVLALLFRVLRSGLAGVEGAAGLAAEQRARPPRDRRP